MAGKVVALVGAQFGSEAKGIVAAQLADQFDVHVRTGGPNAGHTAYVDGKKFVGRSIPMGFCNRNASLVIGPGAVIDVDVLKEELEGLEAAGYDISSRLFVDSRAGIITYAQHHYEGGVEGYAHENIGSTGEGVGIARIARISRNSILPGVVEAYKFEQASDNADLEELGVSVLDTVPLINGCHDLGTNILLEGTQGSGLSLIHGPEWPYCTSADTNAGQLAVDAGLSPSLISETILVARTYPIRVAGNSGPLPKETSWEALGRPEETTTVTKKVRRVAQWDPAVVRKAVLLNRPAKLVLTFMNYLHPGEDGPWPDTYQDAMWDDGGWIKRVGADTGAEVAAVSYDPYKMLVKEGELTY